MFSIRRWQPDERQIMQLLINRGYVDAIEVEFARAYHALEGGASILEVAIERGYVTSELVDHVLHEAREDELLRGLIRRHGLLRESQLAWARKQQHGTKRSLLTTLLEEGLCPPALRVHLMAISDAA